MSLGDNSHKKRSKFLLPIVLIAIIIAAGVWVFIDFSGQAVKYVAGLSMRSLEEYTLQDARSTKVEVMDALYMIKSTAAALCSTAQDSPEAQKRMREICSNTSLNEIWAGDLNGVCVNTSGTSKDISQADYFSRARLGESFVTSEVGFGSRGRFIVISAPIIRDGKVTGNVYGEYSLFRLSQILNSESFKGEGYSILITPKGDYITTSYSKNVINRNERNFWEFMRDASFGAGYSYSSMREDMLLRKSGFTVYSFGGKTRVAYYMPVGINNWYVVKMVTLKSIMSDSEVLKKMVLPLIFKIVALLLLIGAVASWYLYKFDKARIRHAVKFQSLVDNIPGGVAELLIGDDLKIVYANEGFYSLTGYARGDNMAEPLYFLSEEEKKETMEDMKRELSSGNNVHAEYYIRQANGAVRWLGISGTVMKRKAEGVLVQAIFIDITQNRERTEQLIERARHDKMTQLYDKMSAQEIIGRKLAGAHRNTLFAMAVMDIDDFKNINDTYGHETGDKVIIAVADAMRRFFRDTDICGRIGGDEFVIFMINAGDEETVERRLTAFLTDICGIKVDKKEGVLTCSIGAAISSSDEHLAYSEIFKTADENLYAAKRNGKGCCVVSLTDKRS
jgi:diguanylate cyclase (GGDEF)-like protein/PAS domain S-box-containing protein